jgi:ectoine hydroxylase-related dioxygenase (phytanoyl-CoA dioxygenase family)
LIEEEVDLSKAVPVQMKAGSILLFNALLWHSSKGNQTDQVRRAFIVSYQEGTVPKGRGKQFIVLRPAL